MTKPPTSDAAGSVLPEGWRLERDGNRTIWVCGRGIRTAVEWGDPLFAFLGAMLRTPQPPPEAGSVGDANVEAIRAKLLERSARGIAKYGVTTERDDLSSDAWLRHLQEELLDAAVYVEAALSAAPAPKEALQVQDVLHSTAPKFAEPGRGDTLQ